MITTPDNIAAKGLSGTMRLRVRDVTGTNESSLDLDPRLTVGAVAESVAASMLLPADTRWSLRDEATAAFLPDDAAIGEAASTDGEAVVSLVITPQVHLGGRG